MPTKKLNASNLIRNLEMSDWSKIKAGFIEWLKTQDVNYDEKDKDFAPIKYSEQFKLYINKEDGDDTTNMDSFTKQLKTEDGKENTKKTLFDSMVEDYINNLQKDDAVFVAIDGLTTGEKDGKLDASEKNMFLTKISEAGFDGKLEDLSFEDLLLSVNKIKSGDTSFLDTEEPAGPGPGPGPSNPPGDKVGALTKDQVETVKKIAGYVQTWMDPQEVKQVSSGLMKNVKIDDSLIGNIPDTIEGIDTQIGNIDSEISVAQTDFKNFKTQYETNKGFLNQSANIQEDNSKAFDAIVAKLKDQGILEEDTKIQIESLQTTIASTQGALEGQYEAKDALTSAIGGIDSQIWNLNALLNKDEAELPRGMTKSSIQAQISALKEEKQRLTEELAALSEEIVATKEILDSAYENLDIAYQNVETVIETKGNLTKEEKEAYQITVNNQREISKAKKNMDSAKAAMVALDGYIKSLQAQKENLKLEKARLIEDAAAEENRAPSAEERAQIAQAKEEAINDIENANKDDHLGELSEKGFKQGFEKPAEGEETEPTLPSEPTTDENGVTTQTYESNGVKITATTKDGETTYKYEITEGDKTITIEGNTIDAGDVKITRTEDENGKITTTFTVGNKNKTTTLTRLEGAEEATTAIETKEGDKVTSKSEVTSKDDGNGNITTTTTSFKADAEDNFTVKDTQTVITKNTEGKTTIIKDPTTETTKKRVVETYDENGEITVSTYEGTNMIPSETTVYSTNAEGNKTITTTIKDPTTEKVKSQNIKTYSQDGRLTTTTETEYADDGTTKTSETVTLYDDDGKTPKAQYGKAIQEGREVYAYATTANDGTAKNVMTIKSDAVNDDNYKEFLDEAYEIIKDKPNNETTIEIEINGKKYQASYEPTEAFWLITEKKEETETEK